MLLHPNCIPHFWSSSIELYDYIWSGDSLSTKLQNTAERHGIAWCITCSIRALALAFAWRAGNTRRFRASKEGRDRASRQFAHYFLCESSRACLHFTSWTTRGGRCSCDFAADFRSRGFSECVWWSRIVFRDEWMIARKFHVTFRQILHSRFQVFLSSVHIRIYESPISGFVVRSNELRVRFEYFSIFVRPNTRIRKLEWLQIL